MTIFCPNGHRSAASDYCDTCGARLDSHPPADGAVVAVDEPDTAAAAEPEPCPDCGVPRSRGDRFCEACGHDFVAAVPVVVWEALVSVDRQRYGRFADSGLAFPDQQSEQRVALDRAEVNIGRARPGAQEPAPDIDLGGVHDDPAVSRLHAALVRQPDGGYAVVDLDSTNGTTVNDDPEPIAANTPVPLRDGDRIGLGAWTTVTLRRRERGQKSWGARTPAAST
jgi:hypothetical protein